ncbi:VWA domain-containing protein [Nocardia takedensis]|uniref:VWA domain-containing protein n=1 Tax=Nocardia takedensis TaxID=259390 RepID=UPI003F773483
MGKLSKLGDLARKAGKWLGLGAAAAPVRHSAAIDADRFDAMTWTETRESAPALGALGEQLHERYDYTADLLQDVFLAAYKHDPTLRGAEEMQPSRLANRAIVEQMLASPEYADLHRETAGDEFAAALAVLAQAPALREMLEKAKQTQQAAEQAEEAQRDAEQAGAEVAEAMQRAADAADAEGNVPAEAARAGAEAIERAEAAEQDAAQALAAAQDSAQALGPAIRGAARRGLQAAVDQVREDQALMLGWGVEPATLTRMSFAERAALAERLRGNRLSQFLNLIGRFRQMAEAERVRKVEHGHGEYVGVTLGSDLGKLIPAETANLGVPALRAVFAARFAAGELMQYDTRGEEHIGKGAIIAAIDCSTSMKGEGEAWAKACALALLDQARAAGRAFVGILFSSKGYQKVFEFPAGEPAPIERVIEFVEHFFGGGTDFEEPLSTAAQILARQYNDEGSARGDVVLITDGVCRVGASWLEDWHETKRETDFRAFGIVYGTLSGWQGEVMYSLCDNVRTIADLAAPSAAADLFRVI